MNQPMQEVAEKFEAAYIQNGGLLLAVQYDPDSDFYYKNPEYEGLSEEEHQGVVDDVNCFYEGFKLALKAVAVQSIAPEPTGKPSWYFTPFTWAKNNTDPDVEHIECSSKGTKRYSAFCAYMDDGRTLEQHYQCDVKGYDVGGKDWRLGKGKEPLVVMTPEEQYQKYKDLWAKFLTIEDYSDLINQPARLLTDMFATSDINQARAIADLMNEYIAYRVQYFKNLEESCGESQNPCIPCYTDNGACAGNPKDGGALPNNQGEYPEDTQYTRDQLNEPKYYKYENDKWYYHHTQDDLWRASALNYLNKDTIHQLHDLIPVRPEIPLAHTIDPRYKTYTENPTHPDNY